MSRSSQDTYLIGLCTLYLSSCLDGFRNTQVTESFMPQVQQSNEEGASLQSLHASKNEMAESDLSGGSTYQKLVENSESVGQIFWVMENRKAVQGRLLLMR